MTTLPLPTLTHPQAVRCSAMGDDRERPQFKPYDPKVRKPFVDEVQRLADQIEKQRTEIVAGIANATVDIESLQQDRTQLVVLARSAGVTWSDIAEAAAITTQAAHRRWGSIVKEAEKANDD